MIRVQNRVPDPDFRKKVTETRISLKALIKVNLSQVQISRPFLEIAIAKTIHSHFTNNKFQVILSFVANFVSIYMQHFTRLHSISVDVNKNISIFYPFSINSSVTTPTVKELLYSEIHFFKEFKIAAKTEFYCNTVPRQ